MDGIPKNLREIHSLGPATREWLVREGQVPAFERTQTFVAGYSDAGRGYAFVRHQPAFSQLLACIGGEGLALVDGRWQRVSRRLRLSHGTAGAVCLPRAAGPPVAGGMGAVSRGPAVAGTGGGFAAAAGPGGRHRSAPRHPGLVPRGRERRRIGGAGSLGGAGAPVGDADTVAGRSKPRLWAIFGRPPIAILAASGI